MTAVRRSAIPVNVELADSAVYFWEFLKMVDSYPWLYDGLHVHNAVRRYEKYWLPLVSQVDPEYVLSPPLDIQWVWYVHMLSPYAYHRDCLHRFGRVIQHRILSAKDRNIGLNLARELWEKCYRNEKFSLDLTSPPKMSGTFTSKFSYDLFSAISRQRFFNYQVSLRHYRDSKFLERAVKRYKDFLCAKLQDSSLVLNGCFDVQFIWHVHMAHPMTYRDDTRKIFGEMLGHYDTEVGSGSVTWAASPARHKNSSAPKPLPGAMCRGEALICTPEKILLRRKQNELTFKIKLLREEFQHTVTMTAARSRDLVMTPCWFGLPSLTLDCSSHVLNLSNGKSDKVYNVRVTHSVAPVLSTVEIVHPKEFLIATAHTIAGKQIPMKNQLAELQQNCCAYEQEERAMLIRSQKDWGVCVGRWSGAQDSGELLITFYDLETNTWLNVAQSSTQDAETTIYELKLFGEGSPVFINLATGLVTVPCDEVATFIPEIIALAYCIGILYSLCRERTREFYPVEPFVMIEQKGLQPCQLGKQIRASRTTKRDGVFGTGSMGKKALWLNRDPFVSNLLLATGRNCPWTPSNSFLRYFHEKVIKVFGQCVLSNDERSSVEALHEIEYVLEYLGVKESKSPAKSKAKKASSPSKERKKAVELNGQALKGAKDRFSNMQLSDMNELTDDAGSEKKGETGTKKKGKKKKKTKRSVDEEHEANSRRSSEGNIGPEDETGDERIGGGKEDEDGGEDRTDGWKGKRRSGGEREDERRDERSMERKEGKRVGWHDEVRDGEKDEWEQGRKSGRKDEQEGDRGSRRRGEWDNERRDDRRDEWNEDRKGRRSEWNENRKDGRKDEWDDEQRDGRGNRWDEDRRDGRSNERDEGGKGERRSEWNEDRRERRKDEWKEGREERGRTGWNEERRDDTEGRWEENRKEERRRGWDDGRRHEKGGGGRTGWREDKADGRGWDDDRSDGRRDEWREDREDDGRTGWREDRTDGRGRGRDEDRRDGKRDGWEGKKSNGPRSGRGDERRDDRRDRWDDERRDGWNEPRRDDRTTGWDKDERDGRRSEWDERRRDGSRDGGQNERGGLERYDRNEGRNEQGRHNNRRGWDDERRGENRDEWKQDRNEGWNQDRNEGWNQDRRSRDEPVSQTTRRDSDAESYFV